MKKIQEPLGLYFLFIILGGIHLFSAVLVVFFKDWGGLNQTQIQILQSIFCLGVVLLEIPTGLVADMVGRRQSLVLGSFLAGLGFLVYGSIPNFWVFLVGELLLALGVSLMSGADNALLFGILQAQGRKEEIQKIRGQTRAARLITYGLSAQVGSWIAARWGLNIPMLLMVIPSFLGALIAWRIPEPVQVKKRENKLKMALKGLSLLKDPQIRRLALNGVGVFASAYFLLWLYQPLLQKLQIPLQYNGLVYSFMVVAEALVAANFGRFQNSAKKFMNFSAFVTGLSFLLVGLLPSPFTLAVVLLFAGGFGLTRMDFIEARIQLLTPAENHATLLSAISLLARLALVPLNPVVGLITDYSLNLAFLLVGTIPFLVLLFLPARSDEK